MRKKRLVVRVASQRKAVDRWVPEEMKILKTLPWADLSEIEKARKEYKVIPSPDGVELFKKEKEEAGIGLWFSVGDTCGASFC
jgi:hypothetical protein